MIFGTKIIVTGYAVERRAIVSDQWFKAHPLDVKDNQVVLTGLHPGQIYQFRVKAYNAIGWSDDSPESAPCRVHLDPENAVSPIFIQGLRDITVMEHEKVRICSLSTCSINEHFMI